MKGKHYPGAGQDALRRLRLEWGLWLLAGGLFAAAGYAALHAAWGAPAALRWLAAAALLLAYQFVSLWRHLPENRLAGMEDAPLIGGLGLANRITVFRSILITGLIGFLFTPRPFGWLAWAPGALFLSGALLDYLDGYVARITGQSTRLGERLDMQWDSVGVMVAVMLTVKYGQAPFPYLLVGFARYLYLIGLWLHRRWGGVAADLPPSRFRRATSGMQMGFLAVILLPVFAPPATQIAAALFMLPTMVSFARDFLHVTGLRDATAPARPGLWRRAAAWLPLVLRAALIGLLASLILSRVSPGAPLPGLVLVAAVAIPALLLGITGRLAALAVVLAAGFGLRAGLNEWRLWAVLLCAILLFFIGTGKYSLWTPEDWLIDHRAGEARS